MSQIRSHLIEEVRGRGLFVGIKIKESAKVDGTDLAKLLFARKLLTKATHQYVLRLAPALVVDEKTIMKASRIVRYGIRDLEKLNREKKREIKEQAASSKSESSPKRKKMTQ